MVYPSYLLSDQPVNLCPLDPLKLCFVETLFSFGVIADDATPKPITGAGRTNRYICHTTGYLNGTFRVIVSNILSAASALNNGG
jgi:hypothetical protein